MSTVTKVNPIKFGTPLTLDLIKTFPKLPSVENLLTRNPDFADARLFYVNTGDLTLVECKLCEEDGSSNPFFDKFEAKTFEDKNYPIALIASRQCISLNSIRYYIPNTTATATKTKTPKIKPIIPEKAIAIIQSQLDVCSTVLTQNETKLAKLTVQIEGLRTRKQKLEELIRISRA